MRRYFIFHFIFALSTFVFFSADSSAQTAESTPIASEPVAPTTAPKAQDKMDKVPDEYIIESMQVYDDCEEDYNLNRYYNCECFSLAFLDERIKQGPTANGSSLHLAISDQCRDAIGAAGPVYQSCLAKANRFEPGTDPEKYCECVANTFVETVNGRAPKISSLTITNFQTHAYSTCRKKQRQ